MMPYQPFLEITRFKLVALEVCRLNSAIMSTSNLPWLLLVGGLCFTTPAAAASLTQVEQPAGAILSAGSSTVDLGVVRVGDSRVKTFTVRNPGDAELILGGFSIGGADAGSFSLTVPPSTPVAAGGTTFFRVQFQPGSVGAKTANLTFTTNQPGGANYDLTLSGNGEASSGKRIHVNAAASGANDGTSWANAFNSLQAAIASAASGDDIWVAAGTYKPATTDRTVSFRLINGVHLYGGFEGIESTLLERDVAANPTILSGDLLGNDNANISPGEPTRSDNSVHVVSVGATATTSGSIGSSTRCDGFIVEGGNANGSPSHYGGGLYLGFTSRGASNVTLAKLVIRRNLAVFDGGGVFNNGDITIESCVFDSNRAGNAGSALLTSDQSAPVLVSSLFTRNLGSTLIYAGDTYSRPEITNCTFAANQGSVYGAAFASPSIRNCIFWGNTTPPGLTLDTGSPNVNSPPTVENCLIEGGFPGIGNLATNPRFININLPEGPDGKWFTDDDGLRLQGSSPAMDAGNSMAILGLAQKDIRGLDRVIGPVEIGSYEHLADTDHDGLPDIHETGTGTYLSSTNTGTSSTNPDTDGDGLPDGREVNEHGSNPNLADTDGDGFDDGFEVNTGFDPALASSTPDALSSIRTAVEFRFNAANGVSYRVEASTDLENWGTIETGIIGGGAEVVRFYSTEFQPKRYFRVRRN